MGPHPSIETCDGDATLVEGPIATGQPGRREEPDQTEAPRYLGRYVVLEELGKGGMGTVYRAYDPKLEREVALKILRRVTDDARARLVREAQAMGLLSHPNVLPVYDVASEGRRLFIAMELVEGKSLREWLDEGPKPWSEVLAVFIAAGQGLHAAHAAGLVHRDFKPGNVLIGDDGRVRVMDFGLARGTLPAGASSGRARSSGGLQPTSVSVDGHGRLSVSRADASISRDSSGEISLMLQRVEDNLSVDPDRLRPSETELLTSLSEDLTQMGTVIGTPAYMAPEQHVGQGADARSDQYGFCVTLWEALFGQRPFKVVKGGDWYRAKTARRPRAVAERGVPRWLQAAVAKGLSPRPSQRFESMPALLRALHRGQRRRRRWAMGLGGAVALGVTVLATELWRSQAPTPCAGAREALAEVWDDARRSEVKAAILATESPLAADTWSRLEPQLEGYAERWRAAHEQACEATLVRGEQPEALMDARMQCLEERRRGLLALVDTLAVADARAVQRAISAVGELPGVQRCAEPEYVQAQVPRPDDPQVAAQVELLERSLASIKARARAGHSAEVLPEALAALEQARELPYAPVLALALQRAAEVSADVGRYAEAEALYQEAYFEAHNAGLDAVRAQTAIALINLVGTKLGRPRDGRRWDRFAQAALESVPHDPELQAWYLNNAGLLAKEESDFGTAVSLLEQALTMREEIHGPEHPRVAGVLNNLAIAYDDQGHYESALALHRRALSMREHLLGPEHPAVATSLLNVSNIHKGQARYDLAIAQLERAHEVYARAYGPDHPNAAGCLVNMGSIHEQLGQYDRALERYDSALGVLRKAQGENHPNVAGTLANIGNVYRSRGDLQRALEYYERAVAIIEKALGPEDSMMTIALINMGLVALEREDYDTAEAHTRRALDITGKTLGLQHPKVAMIYGNLAQIHAGRGEHREALALREQALERRLATVGPEHPETGRAWVALGRSRIMVGEPEAALDPLRRAVDGLADDRDMAATWNEARFLLAKARWSTGARDGAQPMAQLALAALQGMGDQATLVEEIERWLAEHGG